MRALLLALLLIYPAGARQAACWPADEGIRLAALDGATVRFGRWDGDQVRPTGSAPAAGVTALAAVTWRGRPHLLAVRGAELLRWEDGWRRLVNCPAPILQLLPDRAGALLLVGQAGEPAPSSSRVYRLPPDSARLVAVSGLNPTWRASRLDWAQAGAARRLVVTTWKATRFLPVPHRCLFVFSWEQERAVPWWLGSRLSRPFREALHGAADAAGDERLVALEETAAGELALGIYRPIGFGYEGEGRPAAPAGLRHLLRLGPAVLAWGLTEQGPWWGRVTPGEPPRVELLPGAPPDPALPTDIGNGHFAGFWHSKWQVGEVPAAAGGS